MKLIIAGNGIAAITATRTIRAASPDAQIEIYTDEPYPFYLRPRLIQFLAGGLELEDLRVYSPEWYAKRRVGVHLSTPVVGLDVGSHRILLQGGAEATFDRLLLAVGSDPFVPTLEGTRQEGFFSLRSIDDALAIKSHAQLCLAAGWTEAVVIGGGLLGLECANALTILGLEVTVLEGGPWLLHKQIDLDGAAVLEEKLGSLGIRCMTNVGPEAILADGSLSGVLLEDGRTVPGHLVLCTAGVRPNLALARDAGLAVSRGVVVDSEMRTSAEHVYAAGDVIEYDGETWCIIPAAVDQARVAGANMVKPGSATYDGTVPSTTLKVVGVDLTSIGVIEGQDDGFEELRKTDLTSGVYQKLVLRNGHIVGAILLGAKARVPAVSRLINEGTDVSPFRDRLLDDEFDLSTLLS